MNKQEILNKINKERESLLDYDKLTEHGKGNLKALNFCFDLVSQLDAIHNSTQIVPSREMIARMAMQGMLSNSNDRYALYTEDLTRAAVQFADALLAELKVPNFNGEVREAIQRLKVLAAETNKLTEVGLSNGYITSMRVAIEDLVILAETTNA